MKDAHGRPKPAGIPGNADQLRRQAEATAQGETALSQAEIAAFSPLELQKVLHELRVHQIELEMQNEELRRVQAELDIARERHFDLYDLAPVGYCTVDEDGRILEANLTAATLLGTTRVILVGKPISRFIHKEDQDIYYRYGKRRFEGDESHMCELRMVKRSGETFWALLEAATPNSSDGARIHRIVISDVSEQRALRDSLAKTDRMASMGLLAAGVAHEINNPLTSVLFNLETLARDLPILAGTLAKLGDALREKVGAHAVAELSGDGAELIGPEGLANLAELSAQAHTGAKRISEITKSLSFFSHPVQDTPLQVDLNTALEEAARMAENEIKVRAVLTRNYGVVPAVLARSGSLTQVFLNLLINAAHSINEGAVHENHIWVRTWSETGDAFAEIRDTGCGIRSEDLERIFEPFFTTKGADRGTGLGLAIVNNIVSELGGDIHIESTVGTGTRAVVRLPIAPAGVELAPPASTGSIATTSPVRGRILVVDDEKSIRLVIGSILSKEHDVVTADCGRKARELIESDQNFDLILCDLMMSDVSGIELHEWLSENQPRLAGALVFITGGVFTPVADAYLRCIPNSVIQKPFDTDALQQIVRERVIAARPGNG